MNRTGTQTSPVQCKEMVQGAADSVPTSPGDASGIWRVRAELARETGPLGSVPPPGTFKGMAKRTLKLFQGVRASFFLDKLGERAGFERTGVRLYEAVLSKLDVHGTWDGGPSRDQLERIRLQELSHFLLMRESIEHLGGDPNALTPQADLVSVMSMGLPKVVTDPRINLRQSLEALLVAELTDNASWELLISLSREMGLDDLVPRYQQALDAEAEHLVLVRGWLAEGQRQEIRLGEEPAGAPA